MAPRLVDIPKCINACQAPSVRKAFDFEENKFATAAARFVRCTKMMRLSAICAEIVCDHLCFRIHFALVGARDSR